MAKYQKDIYILKNLTNLHAGSGEKTVGLVDNVVQREGKFPTINSSSLKGALKEHLGEPTSGASTYIFGNEKDDENLNAGEYNFLPPVELLSIPIRSDKRNFCNVTCGKLLQSFLDKMNDFGLSTGLEADIKTLIALEAVNPIHFIAELNDSLILEDLDISATKHANTVSEKLKNLLGENLVLVSEQTMIELTDDETLPIQARNQLLNGESKNLWYEQYVPRQARFSFIVLRPDEEENYAAEFDEMIKEPVQVGANASIGFGFCSIKPLSSYE
jgi:CRISPR-associated protein Cmr4